MSVQYLMTFPVSMANKFIIKQFSRVFVHENSTLNARHYRCHGSGGAIQTYQLLAPCLVQSLHTQTNYSRESDETEDYQKMLTKRERMQMKEILDQICERFSHLTPYYFLPISSPCLAYHTVNDIGLQSNHFERFHWIPELNGVSSHLYSGTKWPSHRDLEFASDVVSFSRLERRAISDLREMFRNSEVMPLEVSSLMKSLNDPFEDNVLICRSLPRNVPDWSNLKQQESPKERGLPDAGQLNKVFNTLSESLPELFTKPLDYSVYADDIVFENRIRNTRTTGLPIYTNQIALLKIVSHFKFTYVKFDILKITKHPEEGIVKVRWRIQGISILKIVLNLWKLKPWKKGKEILQAAEHWYDGFSTFYVNSNGKICVHVADKMMPDEERNMVTKGPVAVALSGILAGLLPRPNLDDIKLLPEELISVLSCVKTISEQFILPLDDLQ